MLTVPVVNISLVILITAILASQKKRQSRVSVLRQLQYSSVLGFARDLISERATEGVLEDPGAAREVIKDIASLW